MRNGTGSALERLSRVLRDRRGTLYEIPILLVVLLVSLSLAAGQRGWERRLLAFFLIPGGLGALFLAAWGFERCKAELGLRRLRKQLGDPRPEARRQAARGLGGMWTAAAPAAPALLDALRDADAGVRLEAAVALSWIGSGREPAVTVLISFLNGRDLDARERAADALARMGKDPKAVAPKADRP